MIFRNARGVLKQFPERKLVQRRLDWPAPPRRIPQFEQLAREFVTDTGSPADLSEASYLFDVRVRWLADLLKELAPEKVLVICRSKQKAIALAEALRKTSRVSAALFHEDLSLLQRDRNAAWFAGSADAAQTLICSEIGSEGRNFQFAHHLVLFDLPLSSELLEQRIGRLYRIGQEHTVSIHVPYLSGSAQEMLLRWYREGLDAFENSVPGAPSFEEMGEKLKDLALQHLQASDPATTSEAPEGLSDLLLETREIKDEVSRELSAGRDRLLELSSFRPREAESLVEEIRRWDEDRGLDSFVADALDYLGVDLEQISARTFVFRQGAKLVVESLPGFRSQEVAMTSDRNRSTHQGELDFLTWDHPMVGGVLDLLLGAERG
ncbi:MAG: helicase-related protein, partial [Vicinamibacteria bacterium]